MMFPPSWKGAALLPKALAVLLSMVGSAGSALAWGEFGHESIALVAWGRLTPAQQATINQIFAGAPSIYGGKQGIDALMLAAVWPDQLRIGHQHGGTLSVPLHIFAVLPGAPQASNLRVIDNLHFADFDGRFGNSNETLVEPQDNVATAVQISLTFLTSRSATPLQKGEALAFLVHCAGDAHQPLHDGFAGDLGGNIIATQGAGSEQNLHGSWDTGFFQTTPFYTTQQPPTAFVNAVLNPLIGGLQSAAVSSMDPNQWVKDGNALANKYAYVDENGRAIQSNTTLSATYIATRLAVAEAQLVISGIRLGEMLKQVVPTTTPAGAP